MQKFADHPYLNELLSPVNWANCTDAELPGVISLAVDILKKANIAHMNTSEHDTLAPELAKLRDLTQASSPELLAVGRMALHRLAGVSPPRFDRNVAKFTYAHDMTALCENLSIWLTMKKLNASKLGEMMYGEARDSLFKPKDILKAIGQIPSFASLSPTLGPLLGRRSISGLQIDELLFSHLNVNTTLELSRLDANELWKQASDLKEKYPDRPVFIVANLAYDAQHRRRLYNVSVRYFI